MTQLIAGDTVRGLISDDTITIGQHLGSGGQAEVYAAEDSAGKQLAVKHYFPASATKAALANLKSLAQLGRPSEKFAWIIEPVRPNKGGSFGYVMPRCPDDYVKLADYLAGRVTLQFRTLCRLSLNLVNALREIHAPGRCYADFSPDNFSFHPETGEVLVFDNDNVVPNHTPSTILGTPDCMAPELFPFAAEQILGPDIRTDQYSLAVVLYLLWMREHPLHGLRMDREIGLYTREALLRWYGKDGTFALDPSPANSNPADPQRHAHAVACWNACPPQLQELFTQSFTVGRHDRNSRVGDTLWAGEFARLPDYLFTCKSCGADNFYKSLSSQLCWRCGERIRPLGFLVFSSGHLVCLSEGTQLFAHHLKPSTHRYRYDEPLAALEKHPDGGKYGFRNSNGSVWIASPQSGKPFAVPRHRAVVLTPGMQINFGSVLAEVFRDHSAR